MKARTIFRTMAAVLLVLCMAAPVMAFEVTITGEVTEDYQIITNNGEVYDIGEGDQGDALMENVGKLVEVTGILTEEDGIKTITVTHFNVVKA